MSDLAAAWAALSKGDAGEGEALLDTLDDDSLSKVDLAYYWGGFGYAAALDGDEEGLRSAQTRGEMASARGPAISLIAGVSFANEGDWERAISELHRGAKQAEREGAHPLATMRRGEILGCLALIHLITGDEGRGALFIEMLNEIGGTPEGLPSHEERARALFEGLEIDVPKAPKVSRKEGGSKRRRKRRG